MPKTSKTDLALKLMRQMGVVRPRDLARRGIPPVYLQRLQQRGLVRQSARGLYTLAERSPTEHLSLAEAGKRIPRGVICLLSALRFHGLTTQSPSEVWIAIDRKARRPSLAGLPVHIVQFSAPALHEGCAEHTIESVSVRVTNPAKTVVDCFKYRNKIGQDVALEALRDCWQQRKCSMDELWKYAKLCRVSNVMRPYLETLP